MKTKQLIEGFADTWAIQWMNPKTSSLFWWNGSEWVGEMDNAKVYPEATARRMVAAMLSRNPKLADSIGVYQLPVEQYKSRFGPQAPERPRTGTFGQPALRLEPERPRKGIFGTRELRGRFGD
jgi:hypothetical protein